MHWNRVALGVDDVLGILLFIRLLRLHLNKVYLIFCAVALVQLAGSSLFIIDYFAPNWIDYRRSFLFLTAGGWILLLWLVYAFLGAVLSRLPGVLRFSHRLLNITFVAAAILALLGAAKPVFALFSGRESLSAAVSTALVLDRAVSTWALLMLLAVLAFVLWFPIEIPKNLVLFSFGLVLYFITQIGVMLVHDIAPRLPEEYLSAAAMLLIGACFLYWTLTITTAGENASIRMGHGWEPRQQQRLIDQLESMNTALLRGARRS